MRNLELLNQQLDQKLIDFDKEKLNVHEKYDVTKMTEQKLRLNYKGIGQTWNFTNPGHQKASYKFKESDKSGISRIQDIRRPANHSRIKLRRYANESISCAAESHQRSRGKD